MRLKCGIVYTFPWPVGECGFTVFGDSVEECVKKANKIAGQTMAELIAASLITPTQARPDYYEVGAELADFKYFDATAGKDTVEHVHSSDGTICSDCPSETKESSDAG